MGFNQIHETVVTDIFETIRDGIRLAGDAINPKTAKVRNSRSLARATSGLTLAFPVICTNTLPLETATMIAKAIERKNVSMLQMAFSAYNITSDTDAISHLSKFHQNLNLSKMDLDTFMDTMESLGESARIYPNDVSAIKEDCRRNLNFVLDDSINPVSLLEYSEVPSYGGIESVVIQEAPNSNGEYAKKNYELAKKRDEFNEEDRDRTYYLAKQRDADNKKDRDRNYELNKSKDEYNRQDRDRSYYLAKQRDADNREDRDRNYELNKSKDEYNRQDRDRSYELNKIKSNNDARGKLGQASKDKYDQFTKQLLPSDVKKANEMQPTMMIVNFYVNEKDRDLNVAQQFVCGVKSKLYAIDSADIINKIITKHVDSDILLKLVKVSTREISFVKDFLLGLDDAKIDALSKSRKGSSSALFKALERRALKGKIRRSLRLENSAKAISALVISSEEADELKKYENIDVLSSRTIIPIMEKLNLLYFIVVDNTSEAIHMLTDGETEFESYSFTALERENGDAAYKKAINLITKVV